MVINNKRGQAGAFIGVLMLIIAFVIFFFALPFVNDIIENTASTSGTAVSFLIKAIPWITLIFMVLVGIKLILYGGSQE